MRFDRQGSALKVTSMWGDCFRSRAEGKNNPSTHGGQVFPSASTLCTLQVLQPGAETGHLVGELSNATVLLSSVCLTTVKKFPGGNMPDEEHFVIPRVVSSHGRISGLLRWLRPNPLTRFVLTCSKEGLPSLWSLGAVFSTEKSKLESRLTSC